MSNTIEPTHETIDAQITAWPERFKRQIPSSSTHDAKARARVVNILSNAAQRAIWEAEEAVRQESNRHRLDAFSARNSGNSGQLKKRLQGS